MFSYYKNNKEFLLSCHMQIYLHICFGNSAWFVQISHLIKTTFTKESNIIIRGFVFYPEAKVKNVLIDLFLNYIKFTGIVWIIRGLLCFYHLCFIICHSDDWSVLMIKNKLIHIWMAWGWVNLPLIIIFEWTIPINLYDWFYSVKHSSRHFKNSVLTVFVHITNGKDNGAHSQKKNYTVHFQLWVNYTTTYF